MLTRKPCLALIVPLMGVSLGLWREPVFADEPPTVTSVEAVVISMEVVPGDPTVIEEVWVDPLPVDLDAYLPLPICSAEDEAEEDSAIEPAEPLIPIIIDEFTGEEVPIEVLEPIIELDLPEASWPGPVPEGGPFEDEALRNFSGLSLISSPETFPWRMNCKLFMNFGGGGAACSGALIDPKHLITATHCVNYYGTLGSNFVIIPGFKAGNQPYGSAGWLSLMYWNIWSPSTNLDHDIAVIELDRPVGALTSWFGYSWSDSCSFFKNPTHHIPGYPGASPYDGQQMYYRFGTYDSCETNLWGNWTGLEVRFNSQSYGGQSGSGSYFFNGSSSRIIYAVLSNGGTTFFGTNFTKCPRLTSSKYGYISNFIQSHRPSSVDLHALDANAAPTTVNAGANLSSFNYVVHNYSQATFSGTRTVEVRLSSNNLITTADTLIQTHSFGATITPLSSVTVGTTPVTIPAATLAGNYFLGVIIQNADANTSNNDSSGWDAAPITVVCPAPTAVTGLSATSGSLTNKIRVTWTNNSSATGGYTLYRDTNPISTNPTPLVSLPSGATSYDDTGVIPGIDYCYWIRAFRACGTSTALAGPMCGWAGLAAPPLLSASDCTFSDRIQVRFFSVWGATCYRILRTDNGGPPTTTGWCPSGITGGFFKTYTDTNVQPCHTYCYQVQAAPNNLTRPSSVSNIDCGCVALLSPAGVAASDAVFVNHVRVTWFPVTGASHYRVWRDGSPLSVWQTGFLFDDPTADRCLPHPQYSVEAACDAAGSRASPLSAPDTGYPGIDDDCNNNALPDECEIAANPSLDCQPNAIPDECDIDPTDPDGNGQVSADGNSNDYPDECEDTRLFCTPLTQNVIAGQTVTVDVFVEGAMDVNSYQVQVLPNTTPPNMLTLSNCYVDETRPDYLFAGIGDPGTDFCNTGGGTLYSEFVIPFNNTADAPFGSPKYLGTFEYTVSPTAPPTTTLQVEIQPDPDSLLLDDNFNSLPFVVDPPCTMNFLALQAPTAQGIGPRYLQVQLGPANYPVGVAIRIESPACVGLSQYVDATGCLVGSPVYRTPATWGTVYVTGADIVPEFSYTAIPENIHGANGPSAPATTWKWCDVNNDNLTNNMDRQRVQLCVACTANPSGSGCPASLVPLKYNAQLDESPFDCPGGCTAHDYTLVVQRLSKNCNYPHAKPCIGCDPVPAGCPSCVRSGLSPEGEEAGGAAVVRLVALSAAGPADSMFLADAFVENVTDLSIYQLQAAISGGTGGDLVCAGVWLDTSRSDYVFSGMESLPVMDQGACRFAAFSEEEEGANVGSEPRYLGTFLFQASADAAGVFDVDLSEDGVTSLLADSEGTFISIDAQPITITITAPPAFGDYDLDGDVDLDDYLVFSTCLGGPDQAVFPSCGVFDAELDHDVDLRDVAALQRAFTGLGDDTAAPVITCPPNEVIGCELSTEPSTTGTATAVDDRDPAPVIQYLDSSSGTCPIVLRRTWTATDAASNTASCDQIITREDILPPMLFCPPEAEVVFSTAPCSATPGPNAAAAADNCDATPAMVGERSDGLALNAPLPVGVTFITWTATDDCGRESTCVQRLEVPDCNANNVSDICDVTSGTSDDCDTNGVPDECANDCNTNGIADPCEIGLGLADCNEDGTPDECQPDCNGNGSPDDCDIWFGGAPDCNSNGIPDSCDIAAGTSQDTNLDGIPDECQAFAQRETGLLLTRYLNYWPWMRTASSSSFMHMKISPAIAELPATSRAWADIQKRRDDNRRIPVAAWTGVASANRAP